MHLLWRLLRLPRRRAVLLMGAAFELVRAQRQVRRRPFAQLASGLGPALPAEAPAETEPLTHEQRRHALDVAWAVDQWTRRWPWPPTCLMQALAARRLLGQAGLPSLLVFGVRASHAGPPATAGVGAHAWLRSGDLVLTGASEAALHRPIAQYRTPARPLRGPGP